MKLFCHLPVKREEIIVTLKIAMMSPCVYIQQKAKQRLEPWKGCQDPIANATSELRF